MARDLSTGCGGLFTEDFYVDDQQIYIDISGVDHLNLILPDHFREIIELLTTESTETESTELSECEFWEWVEQEECAQIKIKEPRKQLSRARVSIKTFLYFKAVFHARICSDEATYGNLAEAEETLRKFDVNGVWDRGRDQPTGGVNSQSTKP